MFSSTRRLTRIITWNTNANARTSYASSYSQLSKSRFMIRMMIKIKNRIDLRTIRKWLSIMKSDMYLMYDICFLAVASTRQLCLISCHTNLELKFIRMKAYVELKLSSIFMKTISSHSYWFKMNRVYILEIVCETYQLCMHSNHFIDIDKLKSHQRWIIT